MPSRKCHEPDIPSTIPSQSAAKFIEIPIMDWGGIFGCSLGLQHITVIAQSGTDPSRRLGLFWPSQGTDCHYRDKRCYRKLQWNDHFGFCLVASQLENDRCRSWFDSRLGDRHKPCGHKPTGEFWSPHNWCSLQLGQWYYYLRSCGRLHDVWQLLIPECCDGPLRQQHWSKYYPARGIF